MPEGYPCGDAQPSLISTRRNSRWGLFIGMARLRDGAGGKWRDGSRRAVAVKAGNPCDSACPFHAFPQSKRMTSNTYRWPDGKRIAVAVTVMLETWSEGKAALWGAGEP